MHPVTTAPPRQSFDNHVQQYQQMPFKAPSQALHQQVNSPTYNRNGSATYALPIVTHQTTVYLPNELLPKPIEQDNVHRQISHLSPPQLLMPQPRGPQSPRYDQENIIELHRLKAENTRLKQDN